MQGESPTAAATRAIEPTLTKIREGTQLPAHLLPLGCAVKVAGEWCAFEGLHPSGVMLLNTGSAGFTHRPTEGETFVWSSPF